LEQDSEGRYRLGYGFVQLAFSYYERLDEVERIRPALMALAEWFGETTHTTGSCKVPRSCMSLRSSPAGASWWRRLWSVTLPMISEQLQFLSVINVIYTFTALFSFVFVITGGGPGFTTTTIDYYTYVTTFENGEFGYGAALAVVLFVIVLVLTIAQFKLLPQHELQ
jgi:hypothetical protein